MCPGCAVAFDLCVFTIVGEKEDVWRGNLNGEVTSCCMSRGGRCDGNPTNPQPPAKLFYFNLSPHNLDWCDVRIIPGISNPLVHDSDFDSFLTLKAHWQDRSNKLPNQDTRSRNNNHSGLGFRELTHCTCACMVASKVLLMSESYI